MSFSMGADERKDDGGIEPMQIPGLWQRVAAISMDRTMFACVWGARNRDAFPEKREDADRITIYEEMYVPLQPLPMHAHAIKMRGAWIPIVFSANEFGRSKLEGQNLVEKMVQVDLNITPIVGHDEEAGVANMMDRLQTDRLRVDQYACKKWFQQKQTFRRGLDGKIPAEGFHLMRATALICGPGVSVAVSERKYASDEEGMDMEQTDRSRNPYTGY